MIFRELLFSSNPLLVKVAAAAGTGDTLTFTEVDLSGFDSVMFLAALGAITATGVGTLRAKGSNVSNTYGAGTVGLFEDPQTSAIVAALGGNGAADDSNKLLVLDINRPLTRYVRGELVRATANIVLLGAIAIPYNSRVAQTTPTGVGTNGTGAGTAGAAAVSNPIQSTT